MGDRQRNVYVIPPPKNCEEGKIKGKRLKRESVRKWGPRTSPIKFWICIPAVPLTSLLALASDLSRLWRVILVLWRADVVITWNNTQAAQCAPDTFYFFARISLRETLEVLAFLSQPVKVRDSWGLMHTCEALPREQCPWPQNCLSSPSSLP
jgi:hypothetical protein